MARAAKNAAFTTQQSPNPETMVSTQLAHKIATMQPEQSINQVSK